MAFYSDYSDDEDDGSDDLQGDPSSGELQPDDAATDGGGSGLGSDGFGLNAGSWPSFSGGLGTYGSADTLGFYPPDLYENRLLNPMAGQALPTSSSSDNFGGGTEFSPGSGGARVSNFAGTDAESGGATLGFGENSQGSFRPALDVRSTSSADPFNSYRTYSDFESASSPIDPAFTQVAARRFDPAGQSTSNPTVNFLKGNLPGILGDLQDAWGAAADPDPRVPVARDVYPYTSGFWKGKFVDPRTGQHLGDVTVSDFGTKIEYNDGRTDFLPAGGPGDKIDNYWWNRPEGVCSMAESAYQQHSLGSRMMGLTKDIVGLPLVALGAGETAVDKIAQRIGGNVQKTLNKYMPTQGRVFAKGVAKEAADEIRYRQLQARGLDSSCPVVPRNLRIGPRPDSVL